MHYLQGAIKQSTIKQGMPVLNIQILLVTFYSLLAFTCNYPSLCLSIHGLTHLIFYAFQSNLQSVSFPLKTLLTEVD